VTFPVVRVAEVAQQIRGVTYTKTESLVECRAGYLPVLRAGNIQDTGLDFTDLVYVPAARVRDMQKVRKNDVVIAASSGSLDVVGKAARSLADFEGGFGAFCKVLRPSAAVDPSYFAHFFKTPAYRRRISSLAEGANINNLRNEHLDDLDLPLPPLDEQRRIAAILDQADALRAKRRQAIAHLDALEQSLFLDTFGDPREWPMRWPMGRIGDIAESVQYGSAAKAGSSGAWPMLRMGNLNDRGRLDLTDLKYIDLAPSDVPKYTVRRGDLLFNRTNSAEKVGKTAVVETDEPLAFAGYLVRVRLKSGYVSHFVGGYLNSAHGKGVLRGMAKTAVNQANINATEMRSIAIALPPQRLQDEFAARLRSIQGQRERLEQDTTELMQLFESVQHRAFAGAL
jgi:type I restriction enzyme, S subunit